MYGRKGVVCPKIEMLGYIYISFFTITTPKGTSMSESKHCGTEVFTACKMSDC